MSTSEPAIFGLANTAARENTDIIFDAKKDPFWEAVDAPTLKVNWNQVFPYQFLILERIGDQWRKSTDPRIPGPFTLPIPPQTLDIEMPFAAQVEVNQGGVVEQFSGAPIRDIVLTGNTGVLPLRGTVASPQNIALSQSRIFLGTLNAVTTIAQQPFATLLGVRQTPNNVIEDSAFQSEQPDSPGFATGYYQFLLLKRYLEWYAKKKTERGSQNFTLAFAVWKEREVYLVTPLKFSVKRAAGKGLHYNYSISLRAWKRVILKDSGIGSLYGHQFAARDPNVYARVMNTIDIARRTLENGQAVLEAVRADINNIVFGSLRQVSLFVKDGLAFGYTARDLPFNLAADFKQPILERLGQQFNNQGGNGELPSASSIASALSIRPNDVQTDPKLAEVLEGLRNVSIQNQKSKTGAGVSTTQNKATAAKAMLVFEKPQDYPSFWGAIKVDSLSLRPATVIKIEEQREAVRSLRREDFERMVNEMTQVLADLSSIGGAADATYDSIYGASSMPLKSAPSSADWEVMGALMDAIEAVQALAASSSINRQDNLRAIDIVAGLAKANGIAFTVPTSKYLVSFPYGYTLEKLAALYLGDPDRWPEIATLNGLKTPFVDEVGRIHDLVTNGNGSQVAVPTLEGYYVGQPVWLTAIGVLREKRRITKIDVLNPTLVLLTLDGVADLEKYKVALEANIQSFLPETVNSLQFIYIPSDEEVETDWLTKSIPGVDFFDPMTRIGGVDLLLDQHGDLVIAPDGTTRLSVGLANLIQRVRIAVATPQGSLQRHPSFGFGVTPGSSTADVDVNQVAAAAKAFIGNEEGFTGVNKISVVKNGGSVILNMNVGIAGLAKEVPVSVKLR
jgi:hypothetical protein